MMDRSPEKSCHASGETTEFEIDKGQSAPKSKMKQKAMKPPEITPYLKVHWRNQDSHPPLPSVLVSDKGSILCSLCPRLSRLSCLSCNKSHYCSIKCKRDVKSSHLAHVLMSLRLFLSLHPQFYPPLQNVLRVASTMLTVSVLT